MSITIKQTHANRRKYGAHQTQGYCGHCRAIALEANPRPSRARKPVDIYSQVGFARLCNGGC